MRMSGKFLHVLGDETEVQNQIGCMNGIFQLFDRQCLLCGSRSNHKRKWLPSGQNYSDSSSVVGENSDCSPLVILDKSPSKNFCGSQRISMKSSRNSFSSPSCSSSFSSLDCNKCMPDHIIFPGKSSQVPTKLQCSDMDTRPGDLQNVMKESTPKDPNGLSVKTSTKKEAKNHQLNHIDSPRPVQILKSMSRFHGSGLHEKSRMPLGFDESLQVLLKLKEAPWNFSEAWEPTRSSSEGKHTCCRSVSREAPRFSYDAKEFSYSESSKHASELREAPRLSLDSKQGSVMGCNLEAELNSVLKDSEKTSTTERSGLASNLHQELVGHTRHSNIITKLMGLETMPSLSSTSQEPMELSKSISSKGCMLSSGRRNNDSPQPSDLHSCSMKNGHRTQNHISKSKVPLETAPWRQQQQRLRVTKKSAFGSGEASLKQKAEFDHCKIARMLKELEFTYCNKDLMALKQILDTMQEKVLLERKRSEDNTTRAPLHNNAKTSKEKILKSGKVRNERFAHSHMTLLRGNDTPPALRSPIVIMKPVSPITPSERKKSNVDSKVVRECTYKTDLRETSCHPLLSTDHYSTKIPSKMAQGSSRPQRPSRENNGASVKNAASSLSPRMHQRKLEMEKTLHRPPSPSSELKNPHRHSGNNHSSESVSPRGKLGRKHLQVLENNDRLSEVSSETRNFNQQFDKISVQSDGDVSLRSQVGIQATSADGSAEMNLASNQQSREANNVAAPLKENNFSANLSEDVSNLEIATTTPEQPSPVSVLDASFYQENLLPSIKRISTTFQDEEIRAAISETSNSRSSTEVNHKRLAEIEILVKKLSQLSSSHGEPQTVDHIAALCVREKPEHRYVSEILLVSGLLTQDLASEQGCTWSAELHPSGYLINPDLFLVLEQTKSSLFFKLEHSQRKLELTKSNREKLQRKLVFDVVNEVLVQKLELTSISPPSCMHSRYRKLSASIPRGQRLLRELCAEIDQLQAVSFNCENCNDDDDDDKLIMGQDILQRSQGWEGFRMEVLELALEIERYVFKELIDEVVCGELATALQCKPDRRRQLFSKVAAGVQ